MTFFKRNIFGILAIISGLWLMVNTIFNIIKTKNYNDLKDVGEYVAVKENIEPNLMTGGLKISLIFLLFLLLPVVSSIIHKRKKGNNIVLYLSLTFVLINFLIFPYLLMLIF